MRTHFCTFLFILFISVSSHCQTQITDILTTNQGSYRLLSKQIEDKEFLLAISQDDNLHVFEIQNDELIKKDERHYPDIFTTISYNLSESYFLTSNTEGSIAYNITDNSEFLIPYTNNNYKTQWRTLNKDYVRLLQSGSWYNQMHVDLITQEVDPRPRNETLLDLTDNFKRIRREFENDEDEIHILTNLETQDSIVINTGKLYGRYSDFNDHYFIYRKDNQIIKVDNSNFESTFLTEIPSSQTFRQVSLVDEYSLVCNRMEFSDYHLSIYDGNNNLVFDEVVDFELTRVHNEVVANNILLSGNFSDFTSINLNSGNIRKENFPFYSPINDLNDQYLLLYWNGAVFLVSKSNLNIFSTSVGQIEGQVSTVTTSGQDGQYHLSLDIRTGQNDALFNITETSLTMSSLLNNETSGLSSSSSILTTPNQNKLLLIDNDDKFMIDKDGYSELITNPVSELFLASQYKIDSDQICWSENTINSNFQIKCFKDNQILDYGTIPNLFSSPLTLRLLNFSVKDGNVLYLKSLSSSTRELRIKKFESGQDSLIGNFSFANSLLDINNQPFFNISDSLYTYDFQNDILHNLDIPVEFAFSPLDFVAHNDKVYVNNRSSAYEISGLNSTKIYEITDNDNLLRMSSFGNHLGIRKSSGYSFYNGQTTFDLDLEESQSIKHLGSENIAILNTDFHNEDAPQIYNLITNEAFQLNSEFLDRNIEFLLPTTEQPLLISQNRIDGINYFVFDRFDSDYSNYTNILNIPITTNAINWSTKLIESEEYSILILEETIIYVSNETGEIIDNITVPGMIGQYYTNYKDGILYFFKYESDKGRQVYKYEPTPLTNKNLDKVDINIYPNPTNKMMTIKSSQTFQSWNLYSVEGQKIMGNEIPSKEVTIDIGPLSSGLYYLEIILNGLSSSKKILKL